MSVLSRRLVLGAASLLIAGAGLATAQDAPPPPTPMTIVVYEAGPAFKAGRPLNEQPLGPHLGYVAERFKAGDVVAYGTEAGKTVRGYYVLKGAEPEVAKSFVVNDPGVTAHVLRPATSHVWQVIINGFSTSTPGQAFTILRMTPGPKWVKGKPLIEQDVQAHFGYMVAQAKAGVVIAAGPDGSGQQGWYVLNGDVAAANRLLADDPGTRSGVLKPVVVAWNVIAMQPTR